MTTFVLVPGAWLGRWVWKKAVPLLVEGGHEVYAVTLTGMGERVHLASEDVGIENLHKKKHVSFLSTLRRLRDDQILTVDPPGSIDDEGSLAWTDTDPKKYREPRRNETRADWGRRMSAVRVVPNLSRLKTTAGSQTIRLEERSLTLRKKGEEGRSITVEGLTPKQLYLS